MSLAVTAVLVVTDEPAIHLVLQDALEHGGFTVTTAGDGETAIAMLEAHNPGFQALITDVGLAPAGLAGWDVAKRARELSPDLPVVYMTGGTGGEWDVMGVPNSILALKPFRLVQMVQAVSRLLNTAG